ncbi:hypothetical protein OB934_23140 [Aeromonas salmonicida]|uniref:hypothetical protein n=1 Tax=Aeromonas salmonicida TaxID=645 RepID=UPI001F3FD6BA|nr:hypothetical protein [Aeromonas salmonicida]MCE9935673.1 hypothetical protein [Aeromonas salmonicida]MDM5065650.1 hypothetical protein [Aeromonas salmonicida]HDO1191565.1 hypothetical protein [Aeromonas salmonicida]
MEKLNSLVAKYENVQAELNDEIISAVTRVIQTREQGLALELVGSLPENHPFMPFVVALAHKINKK